MSLPNSPEPYLTIANDGMEAHLLLPAASEEKEYTVRSLLAFLERHGVHFGVIQSEIMRMVNDKVYNREVLIAKGIRPVDGTNGYFQFNFNRNLNKKPEVRGDGTVDYWNIHAIEIVEAGQEIAFYHEPTLGKDGRTVTGQPIPAKKGRPEPPLTGKGFDRSEDNRVYTANTTGKIEMQSGRILISPIYEIHGDADLHTGHIDFRGDVVIHGNVTAGANIKATGTITVDGTAEACYIEAGKDIILRGGFLGANKGVIRSRGNIYAKFFEYAKVVAEGSVEATYALCSSIESYNKVIMSGKLANIIGGSVHGVSGVEATCLGNDHEVETEIQVGVNKELMDSYVQAEEKFRTETTTLNKINTGLNQFDEFAKEKNLDLRNDERRVALLRAKITKQAEVAKATEEREYLKEIVARGKNATVKVVRNVYPGVQVSINSVSAKVKECQSTVEFIERSGNVIMVSMADQVVR